MTSYLVLVLCCCCLAIGIEGSGFWRFGESSGSSSSLEDFLNSINTPHKASAAEKPSPYSETKPNSAETSGKPSPTDDASSNEETSKVVDDASQKLNKASGDSGTKATKDKSSKTKSEKESSSSEDESLASLTASLRELIKELQKFAPPVNKEPPSSPTAPTPIWQSWANAKSWANQPGPDGKSGGGLWEKFSQSDPDGSAAASQPPGSPQAVWSQIAPKYNNKEETPTVIPPNQIVIINGRKTVMPP